MDSRNYKMSTDINIGRKSLFSQFIIRIQEIIFLIRILVSLKCYQLFKTVNIKDSDVLFCENILEKVSRSFSILVRKLPDERHDFGIFYLILRGLDTLEDDPTAFQSKKDRIEALKSFHTHLNDPNWNLKGIGEGHERTLLENFDSVIRTFLKLRAECQEVITDIIQRMGERMGEMIGEKLDGTQGTKTMEEYNKYCYYMGGLTGDGLQSLLDISEGNRDKTTRLTERDNFIQSLMSLIQKDDIIKDFLEDYSDGRSFWPIPIWSKYVSNLGDLVKPENSKNAVNCLNELVIDALDLVPPCLKYITTNQSKTIQIYGIMFLATLASLSKCYNNPSVFTGVVKIRKGIIAYIFYNSNDIDSILKQSLGLVEEIFDKTNSEDVRNRKMILGTHDCIKELIQSRNGIQNLTDHSFLNNVSFRVFVSALIFTVLSILINYWMTLAIL